MRLNRVDLIQALDLAISAKMAKEKRAGTWPPESRFLQRMREVRSVAANNGPVYISGKVPGVKESGEGR